MEANSVPRYSSVSPIHLHVEEETPVHVHVVSKGKILNSLPNTCGLQTEQWTEQISGFPVKQTNLTPRFNPGPTSALSSSTSALNRTASGASLTSRPQSRGSKSIFLLLRKKHLFIVLRSVFTPCISVRDYIRPLLRWSIGLSMKLYKKKLSYSLAFQVVLPAAVLATHPVRRKPNPCHGFLRARQHWDTQGQALPLPSPVNNILTCDTMA